MRHLFPFDFSKLFLTGLGYSVLPYDPKAPSEPSTTGLVHVSFKTLTAQVSIPIDFARCTAGY